MPPPCLFETSFQDLTKRDEIFPSPVHECNGCWRGHRWVPGGTAPLLLVWFAPAHTHGAQQLGLLCPWSHRNALF